MPGIDDYNKDWETQEQELKANAELATLARYADWIERAKKVGIPKRDLDDAVMRTDCRRYYVKS